jgi:hypothetical protein
MKQQFLRRKTRKHIETGRTSATEQRELVQAEAEICYGKAKQGLEQKR